MNPEVKRVIDLCNAEAEKIETTPCEEVLRLYKHHVVPSGQGMLWKSCFTTMVFAEGDARCLGCYILWPQTRLADNPIFTLEHLKAMFRDTVRICAEFLGTTGLETVWMLAQEVLKVLDLLETKEDFKDLVGAFTAYETSMHNWIHFYFPWNVAEMFPQVKKEDAEELMRVFDK